MLEDFGERIVDAGGAALEREATRARAREAVRVAGGAVAVVLGGGGCCLERGGAVREVVRVAGGAVAVGMGMGAGAGAGAGLGLVRFLGLGRAGYRAVVVGWFSLSKWSLWECQCCYCRAC